MTNSYSALKILVIGLGSMGKRRIRNLQANGVSSISGFDLRNDRRKEANETYGIKIFEKINDAVKEVNFDAWIISVPPDLHHIYMKRAIELSIPCFIEASVVDTDLKDIMLTANRKKIFLAPSCTLYFHPAIAKLKELINNNTLGKLSNFIYHSGQYLPDWHTYENVSEYYVSNKATGGAREIVPFELTWISLILGFPNRIACFYKKTIEIEGAKEIDDTYNLIMDYNNFIFTLCVDVVSRAATRRLVINGDKKQLYWDWNDDFIELFDPEKNTWEKIEYNVSKAQTGYNKNITEDMYNQEIDHFLGNVTGIKTYPNTMENDLKVLNCLYSAERSSDTNLIQVQ